MRGKTIKQIADKIGVSKTAIRSKMTPEFRKLYTFKNEKGHIYITFDGEIELRKLFDAVSSSRKVSEKTENLDGNTETKFSETYRKESEINGNLDFKWLMNQIQSKDDEIERLHDEIEKLHKLLDQAQQLHAASQTKLLQLENKETAVTEEKKKSFFGFFRK